MAGGRRAAKLNTRWHVRRTNCQGHGRLCRGIMVEYDIATTFDSPQVPAFVFEG